MRLKYIMTREGPILFPESIAHDAIRVSTILNIPILPISAGFVRVSDPPGDDESLTVSVYGESVSLDLKPLPGDAEKIKRFLEDS